jgi:hypothetical protein
MTTIDVHLARWVDAPALIATLQAQGMLAELVDQAHVAVTAAPEQLGPALESCVAPFRPIRIDERSYALTPPAA